MRQTTKTPTLKTAARARFLSDTIAKAKKHGCQTVVLRPKGATADEIGRAAVDNGLIPRLDGNRIVVMTEAYIAAAVKAELDSRSTVGGLLIVQDVAAPLRLADFKRWADLNKIPCRFHKSMLVIEAGKIAA